MVMMVVRYGLLAPDVRVEVLSAAERDRRGEPEVVV